MSDIPAPSLDPTDSLSPARIPRQGGTGTLSQRRTCRGRSTHPDRQTKTAEELSLHPAAHRKCPSFGGLASPFRAFGDNLWCQTDALAARAKPRLWAYLQGTHGSANCGGCSCRRRQPKLSSNRSGRSSSSRRGPSCCRRHRCSSCSRRHRCSCCCPSSKTSARSRVRARVELAARRRRG